MKKNLKYLIIVLIFLISVSAAFLLGQKSSSVKLSEKTIKGEVLEAEELPAIRVVDESLMTSAEKRKLNIDDSSQVLVMKRNNTGGPIFYRPLTPEELAKVNDKINASEKTADGKVLMTEDEKDVLSLHHLGVYEVVSRNIIGNVASYRFIKMEEPKKINPEFMSDSEKSSRGFSLSTKIQVLKKNALGQALVYKIVKKDSDIITEY